MIKSEQRMMFTISKHIVPGPTDLNKYDCVPNVFFCYDILLTFNPFLAFDINHCLTENHFVAKMNF